MNKTKIFGFFVILSICSLFCQDAFADVVLRIVVVNPSENNPKTIPVQYKLPKGLAREDIMNTGGLKLGYDVKSATYYVHGDVSLQPKESKTMRVTVKDIWKLNDSEIRDMTKIIDDKLAAMDNPEEKKMAERLADNLKGKLQAIAEQQESLAGDIEKRMELFSVNLEKIKNIREEVYGLEQIAMIALDNPEEEKESIKLVIEAENVLDKTVELPLKYYLPKELIPDYIIDKGDFEIHYDHEKSQFFLQKEETFAAGEKKVFEIQVENIWHISVSLVKGYLSKADVLNSQLKAGPYADIAQALYNEIARNVEAILQSQNKSETITERVSTYRDNQARLMIVRENLDKLRQLLDQAQGELESESVKNILRQLSYLEKLKEISDTLFKDRLKKVAIWKIIMTIVIFLVVLTTFFYTLWFLQLRKDEKKELKKIMPEAGGQKEG